MSDPRKTMVRWFEDGDPLDLCSFCAERLNLGEPDEDSPGVVLWKRAARPSDGHRDWLCARLHQRCFEECIELGIFAWPAG